MRKFIYSKNKGLSLVEIAVVMSIIGITAGIAGVYLSSKGGMIRTIINDLHFDIELAKQEAVVRNSTVYIDWLAEDEGYLLCVDRDDMTGCLVDPANPDSDIEIKREVFEGGISIQHIQPDTPEPILFSALGECSPPSRIGLLSTIRDNSCPGGCLEISVDLIINRVCRVRIGERVEQCTVCPN